MEWRRKQQGRVEEDEVRDAVGREERERGANAICGRCGYGMRI